MELKEFGGCGVLFRGALGARLGVSLMGAPACELFWRGACLGIRGGWLAGGKKNWHPSLKLSDSTKGSQKHVYLRLRQNGSIPKINPAGREVQAQLHSELYRLGVLLLCCYRLPVGGGGLGKLLGASTWVSARALL